MKKAVIITGSIAIVGLSILFFKRRAIKMSSAQIPTSNGAINNFGNIVKNKFEIFKGEMLPSPSPNRKSFIAPEYGYRAIIRNLRTYYTKHHLTTVRMMLKRYASSKGDDPNAYANFIQQYTGYNVDADIKEILFSDKIKPIIAAIAEHEQKQNFVPDMNDIDKAYLIA